MSIIRKLFLNKEDKVYYEKLSSLIKNKPSKFYLDNLEDYKLYLNNIVSEECREFYFEIFLRYVNSIPNKSRDENEYLEQLKDFKYYLSAINFNKEYGIEMSDANVFYKIDLFKDNHDSLLRFASTIQTDKGGSFYYNNINTYLKYEAYCKGDVNAVEFDLYIKFDAMTKNSRISFTSDINADNNIESKFAAYCELIRFTAAIGIELTDIQLYNRLGSFKASLDDMEKTIAGTNFTKSDLYQYAKAQVKNAKYVNDLLGRDAFDENSIDSYIKVLRFLPNYVKWTRFVANNEFVFGYDSATAIKFNKNTGNDMLRRDANVLQNWIANDNDVLDRLFNDEYQNSTIQAKKFVQEYLNRYYTGSLILGCNVKFYYAWYMDGKYSFLTIFILYDELFEVDVDDFGDGVILLQ